MDHHTLPGRNGDSGGASDAPPLHRVNVLLLAGLVGVAALTNWLGSAAATTAAAIAIILFGLPHGAFDMELLGGRATAATDGAVKATGRAAKWRLLAAYLGLLAGAALLWAVAPGAALILFLAMAAAHFGEDWHMLEAGLLRHMAGLSVIAVVAVAWPADVAALFAALTTVPFADALTRALTMAAPVVGLVTLVGLMLAVQRGQARWATAHLFALVIAVLTPPVVGFAAFFVIVHSAIHLRGARGALAGWPIARFVAQGGLIAVGCFAAAWLISGQIIAVGLHLPVLVFKLLAVLTVPHLLLTHGWLPLRWVMGRDAERRAPQA